MLIGTLKTWNAEKSYGFITRDDSEPDVFVHISALANGSPPPIGTRLEFDTGEGRNGRRAAKNVRVITGQFHGA